MANTYTTTITNMYTVSTPDPDYVVNVLFTVSGTDGTHTASIDGNIQFAQEAKESGFIPYAQLTQAEVLSWINESGQIPNLEANIDGQIASMVNPPVSPQNTPLPWLTTK